MIDAITNKRLRVEAEEDVPPTLDLPVSQLDEVRRLLDKHGIRYWVHEQVISFDGGPEEALINFGHSGDAKAIQAILDSVQ